MVGIVCKVGDAERDSGISSENSGECGSCICSGPSIRSEDGFTGREGNGYVLIGSCTRKIIQTYYCWLDFVYPAHACKGCSGIPCVIGEIEGVTTVVFESIVNRATVDLNTFAAAGKGSYYVFIGKLRCRIFHITGWRDSIDSIYYCSARARISRLVKESEGEGAVIGEEIICTSSVIGYRYSGLVEGDARGYVSIGVGSR